MLVRSRILMLFQVFVWRLLKEPRIIIVSELADNGVAFLLLNIQEDSQEQSSRQSQIKFLLKKFFGISRTLKNFVSKLNTLFKKRTKKKSLSYAIGGGKTLKYTI